MRQKESKWAIILDFMHYNVLEYKAFHGVVVLSGNVGEPLNGGRLLHLPPGSNACWHICNQKESICHHEGPLTRHEVRGNTLSGYRNSSYYCPRYIRTWLQ